MAELSSRLTGALAEEDSQKPVYGPDTPDLSQTQNPENPANLLADAEDYVDSVMSSQSVLAVLRTPVQCRRKRNLSMPNVFESSQKKIRGDIQEEDSECDENVGEICDDSPTDEGFQNARWRDRTLATAKRTIKQKKVNGTSDGISAGGSVPENADVKEMIAKLSADMHNLISGVNKKVESLEKSLEKKITENLTKYFDKRVSSESKKIRHEINERFDTLRSDVANDIEDMNDKIAEINANMDTRDESTNLRLNVAIRDLPFNENESVVNKVNSLISDGVKIPDIKVVSAFRKESRDSVKPGVVIAKFKNETDKKKVMLAKKNLKSHAQYRKVFIHHDQSREERVMATNLRMLVNAYKAGDKNINVKGSRIVRETEHRNDDDARGEHRVDRNNRGRGQGQTSGSRNWNNIGNESAQSSRQSESQSSRYSERQRSRLSDHHSDRIVNSQSDSARRTSHRRH